jgi:hypothetical protein
MVNLSFAVFNKSTGAAGEEQGLNGSRHFPQMA